MCLCFWGYLPINYYQLFPLLNLLFSRSDKYWNRYLVGATPTVIHQSFWNYAYLFFMVRDVCVVLGLFCHILFFNFFHFFWCDMMMWVACRCNSSYSFKLCHVCSYIFILWRGVCCSILIQCFSASGFKTHNPLLTNHDVWRPNRLLLYFSLHKWLILI